MKDVISNHYSNMRCVMLQEKIERLMLAGRRGSVFRSAYSLSLSLSLYIYIYYIYILFVKKRKTGTLKKALHIKHKQQQMITRSLFSVSINSGVKILISICI